MGEIINENELLIKGELFGIKLSERGKGGHILLELCTYDDRNWMVENIFSSGWLDELSTLLDKTKKYLESDNKLEEDGFGYSLK